MPISSFYGLQTSLRGLLAQQRALDTTGHNISNASTAGYSRQEAVMAASAPLTIPAGGIQSGAGAHLGTGVEVEDYRRVRDQFLDLQFRSQSMRLGYESTRTQQLERAELALSEPSDNGIGQQLTDYWDAWSDFAKNPTDTAAREALIGQARTLTDAFATVDAQFKLVSDQARAQYDAITGPGGEIAGIANDIANLNTAIRGFVSSGESPNDLMDRRDELLDRLSQYGQVTTTDEGGAVTVRFGGAQAALVDGSKANPTEAVAWPQADFTPGDGMLGALHGISKPGGTIDTYRTELHRVAEQLASSVNGLHNGPGVVGGNDFFTFEPNPNDPDPRFSLLKVQATPASLLASTDGTPGGTDLAIKIAALQGGAADTSYRGFVAKVGIDVREARRMEANAEALSNAVDDHRQSISGVALDEEMTNLVRFQRSYQASARAMSTMDEMLDVLINRTGRVGL